MEGKHFKLVDKEGQERILVLSTKYEKLLPLEKLAFMDLCGFVSTRDASAEEEMLANRGKLHKYMNERLMEVRSREPGFVVMQQSAEVPSDKTPANAGSYTDASSDAALRKLIQPSLYGEGAAVVRKQRKSLYERIGMEGEAEQEEEVQESGPKAPPLGAPGEVTYRSNAYQALRLAHSFPQHVNVRGNTKDDTQTANMINATGMPLYENELRDWFDALDSGNTGFLELEEFKSFMRSLDRDLGVDDEYVRLEQEGERLAANGKLCFEAFAYLVLRFARA